MNIGYLTTKYPPYVGGGETHMATIAAQMAERGHQVEVITGEHTERDPNAFPYPVHQIPGFTDAGIDFAAAAGIADVLQETPLDVLHIVNYESLFYYRYARPIGKAATARTVFSTHNTPIPGIRVFDGMSRHYELEKRAVQETLQQGHIDAFVANSRVFTNGLKEVGVPDEAITEIPFGIDTTVFTPKTAATEARDSVDILCTSRFIPRKGVEHLVAALEHLPDEYRLHLTGSGNNPYPETYRHILHSSQKLGLRVSFATGRTSLRSLVKLYQAADVFVMPSQTEGFGLSALEAMACGTPVVATNVQGLNEFVTDGETGLLVRFGNPLQLARAIRTIHEQPNLSDKITANALAMTRNTYSYERMINDYENLYASVMDAA